MFYSQFILAKKGPLGTIWIAAHLERKLRKNQVAETDIGVTVDNILFPEVPIALRLSGHLLLGVVRIYSRQVNYLFNDCSETLGKIKQAFHAAAVDLPPEATTAPFHSITLPETFDFDELELAPDSESSFLHLNGNYVDHHVTTKEQITLQDCIENNPYLGSSQFGLDERFGDGDGYSFLGLDFDEEFLAEKPRSPSGASTSKPLLKEETIVPQVGCENEVTHMDIDHPCEPAESELQKVSANGGVVNNVFELGQIEGDNQLNAVGPTNSLDPLNESAGLKAPPSNDSDFTLSQPDTPGFHAYTPRNLEACTPDLNQEYCPPDEPSTPALVDETSSPMYQENVIESAGRFSPVMLVNPERNSPFEPLPGSLMPPQVSVVTPGSSSIQGNRSPSPASFQGFPLQQQQQQQSPSPPSFQGFLLQQAAPAEVSREAFVTKAENSQVLSVKGNAAGVSPSFESFPQPSSLQQIRTAVSHEGVVFPAGASSSLLTSSEASLAASHQQIGNPSGNVNYQWAGTVHQEASPHLRQQGLAASPQTRTAVSHEGIVFPAGASSSLLTSPEASLASSHQQIGNPSVIVNNQWAGTVHQEVSPHFQQQGLRVSPQIGTTVSNEGAAFPAAASSSFLTSSEASLAASRQQIGNSPAFVNNQWAGTVHQEVSPHFQQQGLRVSPQIGTTVSHEGAVFPAGVSSSFLTSPQASLAASHQQIGNPSAFVNNQWAGTVHQEVSPHFQNQGLAVSPQQSSFGSLVDSPALQPLRTMQNTVASQVLMSPPVSQTSVIPSFSASSGSVLPMETGLLSGHSVNMDWHKEAAHDLAVTKGLVWQSAAQKHTASSSAAMPSISSSIVMGECETLRSAFDMQRGTPDFLLLQKDMSDERIPGLESDRNKPFSLGIHGVTKEAILPVLDKTPVLREETPFMATTASYLSTHTIDSLPGDDDVLASILGRKSKAFKVVSTPKLPKAPKANVAAKRPRKAPRVTPKKRKIDFDTVAVLHGDVIRQQLANAEDIRRERRKAPCTRREVWSFIRESEGQENFDEPTLPELSSDLHDLYHDVLHGPESRPPASALDGAAKAKETLESEVVRSGERDCVVDCVNVDTNKLDTRGESDPLVDFANNDSSKDVCINVYAGSVENNSLENNAEQLKVDMKGETAQANPCEGSAGSEVVENITAEKLFKPEEDSEGLAGKERDTTSLPESHGSENHITNSIISRETGANEQAVQETELDKQIEGARHAPGDIMVSSFAEKTVGVVGADVGNEGTAMALQQHTESLEEKKQPSSGLDGENFYEGEVAMLSKDADLKALDVPSDGMDATEVPVSEATGGKDATEVPVSEAADGKDATEVPVSEAAEVPVSEAADMDKGNVEDSEKIPTSNPSEEEANLCRVDEEMAGMEFERDTDFLDDDDNDVGYAEIDYSSDEQDVSIQDSGGWSARSRNVGRYLKTVFEEMEGGSKRIEQGATLGLERLLARKTKREAARMFFETLVLKTKDYIHVEQKVAYQDIHLFPRSKLMKTEF